MRKIASILLALVTLLLLPSCGDSIGTDEAVVRMIQYGIIEERSGFCEQYARYMNGDAHLTDYDYIGAMMYAARTSGKSLPPACLKAFLKAGARVDLDHVNDSYNQEWDPEIASLILDYAKLDAHTMNNLLVSLSQRGCGYGNDGAYVRDLLEHGADANIDCGGKTPLLFASEQGHDDVCEQLLAHGANANVKDKTGKTPFHFAVKECSIPVCKLLLDHGANVNAKDNDGKTPLMFDCKPDTLRANYMDVCKLLLGHGANVNAKDKEGKTPLHYAVDLGKIEMCKLLLEHGADVNAKNRGGRTPLQVAQSESKARSAYDVDRFCGICNLLQEHGGE